MANSSLAPAKVILLAVQLSIKSDVATLRALVAQNRKTLRTDIVLRILLTHLPESLNPSEYVQFLLDLSSGQIQIEETIQFDFFDLEEVSDVEAHKKVRKLRLLPLAWPSAPPDAPDDHLILFLIHRAYRIDEQTGLITQLPELLVPFLDHSQYLRIWMTTTLLPLLRLNYEYYPGESTTQTIEAFERLDEKSSVNLLLSKTGKRLEGEGDAQKTIGRDMRGLIGPWMYGDSRWKRRRVRRRSEWDAQIVAPLDENTVTEDHICIGWEEVFKWIISQATSSWVTCVEAIEQWDGPGDVDLGGYGDGIILEEQETKRLEKRYARAILSAAYLVPEASVEALTGIHRILSRIIDLLDYERIPNLPAAAALLSPIHAISEGGLLASSNATHLRTNMMEERNCLTSPNRSSISLLHALLISAFLLTRVGVPCTIRRAGELALLQDEREQTYEAQRLIHKIGNSQKGDDKQWVRFRNEILWLRDWGAEKLSEGVSGSQGRGIFSKVRKDFLETEILKALLTNTRYTLARSIYETSSEKPLSKQQLQDSIVSAAMNAYDNATNANRTRGGVKKCDDIIHAFPDTIRDSLAESMVDQLLAVTHSLGQYRLVLKQGESFTPVILRIHGDPISIVGKVLDQNPKSYTKINDIIRMGEQMVMSGLTVRDVDGHAVMTPEQEGEQLSIARKRVTSMCIDAALAEDDFETAYSYLMNRLSNVASEAQTRTPTFSRHSSGISAHPPPIILDDWSWRAALQAGKYRLNSNTVRPTHLGNASGNLEIRHLEQRMDCLSLALRIAPPSTLHEILNVYRRCEEELDVKVKQEAEQEAAWDEQGDQTTMPGGFGPDPVPVKLRAATAASRAGEAPMSLFDLTRASAAKAQQSLSALTALKSSVTRDERVGRTKGAEEAVQNPGVEQGAIRKRDQLRNAAVGTLASGIGWLINAPPPASNDSD